jgi:small subunit ribosomal protein S20
LAAKKRKLTALKRIRQNIRRAARRQSVKSALRTITKRAQQVPDAIAQAQSSIDRAVGGGIIHRNAAARRKSRLMKRQAQARKRT